MVHKSLEFAWTVNKALPMCFIFDTLSPARQFKQGMLWSDGDDYPSYNNVDLGDVTETDGDPPGWMPYWPRVRKFK
jgi:hypothetical protein